MWIHDVVTNLEVAVDLLELEIGVLNRLFD